MKQYTADKIYNIALTGHSGAGKTTLTEAMLFMTGVIDRMGKTQDGNTVMDYDPEEIKRKVSVALAAAPVEWKDSKINILDAPGLYDYMAGCVEAIRAADSVGIVVSAKGGINVGTERGFKFARRGKRPRFFIINGMCDPNVDYYALIDELKERYGYNVCPVFVPVVEGGKASSYIDLANQKAYTYNGAKATEIAMPAFAKLEEYTNAIKEAVAETSEELMDKFFGGEEFTAEEMNEGIKNAVISGDIAPIFCVEAITQAGMDVLLDAIVKYTPPAAVISAEVGKNEAGEDVKIEVDESAPTVATIFKTVADPFVGKLSYFKVIAGKVSADTPLVNARTGESERIAKVFLVRGKKQVDVPYVGAGDIGAIPKLSAAATGDTLCSPKRVVTLAGPQYNKPSYSMAIFPKKSGEEDKVAQGIARLIEEDPSLGFKSDKETKEMVLSGKGEQHLDIVVCKLKSKFNVEVTLKKPKVAYREAIRKKVQVQGRHKKQSGGSGQFGDVWIEFEPCDCADLEFAERVVGGSVPKNFFPAVEKGLREAIQKGPLAGYPVVGLKATLYDGSYHPVDSNEMAFKMAAKVAFKNGMAVANPTLLEPVGSLKCTVPDANMGDIMGEVNKRRGRVLGMEPGEDGQQTVEAEVPMAEMHDFSTYIRQVTQGRGRFSFDFVRYEDAPANVAQKVIEAAKAEAGD